MAFLTGQIADRYRQPLTVDCDGSDGRPGRTAARIGAGVSEQSSTGDTCQQWPPRL
jgi:hypothetical protein